MGIGDIGIRIHLSSAGSATQSKGLQLQNAPTLILSSPNVNSTTHIERPRSFGEVQPYLLYKN